MVEELDEHKRFSPSQADRFLACPGSVKLIERSPPRHSTDDADEGTRAHKVLEMHLRHGYREFTLGKDEHYVGWCNPEIIYAVNAALDYIWPLYDELNGLYGDAEMYIETYVEPPVSAAPGEAGGKVDVTIFSRLGRQLYVIDYKHGVGIYKSAKGNKQVTQYGVGVLYGNNSFINPEDVDSVTLVIIQPRSFHEDGEVREYDMKPSEIFDYLMELDAGIEACLEDDAPLKPDPETCRFCPAKTSCPALESKALQVINPQMQTYRDVTKPNLPDPKTFDPAKLSYVLQSLDLVKLWMKDVEKHAYELALDGNPPPGFKLVESSQRRQWHGEEDKLAPRLAALIGCPPDDLFEKKFITITEAEKKVKTAFKKRVSKKKRKQAAEDASKAFAYFTTKQSSGNLTLASQDDPRPAINVSQQTFGDVGKLITPPTKEEK